MSDHQQHPAPARPGHEFDGLVRAAEALHDQTGRVLAGTRRWQRLRQRGVSMSAIVGSDQNRVVIRRATDAARAAARLLGTLRSTVVRELAAQGWTRRQLADLFGVTHQRISKIASGDTSRDAELTGTGA